MNTIQIVTISALSCLCVAWGIVSLGILIRRRRRVGRDGVPKAGSRWQNRTIKADFVVVEPPRKTHNSKPTVIPVRKGFITVHWPSKTFDKHFK